jgi:hypothetical protein
MEKHEETRYVKRTQKDYSMSFKLQLFKKLKEDNLQLRNPQRLMAFKITTVVKWLRKFGNFDWENQTPFTMSKSPEQRSWSLKPK